MQFDLFSELPYNEGTVIKTCLSCKEDKPEDEFYIPFYKKGNIPSRGNVCKKCKQEQQKLRNKLRLTAGTPPERCQCCNKKADLLVDHCHDTLAFRGWICNNCNVGIGQLGDNIEGLEKALAYLKGHYDGQP